jgi:universal stress protein A
MCGSRKTPSTEAAVEKETIRTILVPTDFSEGAERALRWARTLARAFAAKIALLHVVDLSVTWTPVGPLGSIPTPIPDDFVERLTTNTRAALDTMAHHMPEVTSRLVRKGHPREIILEVTQEIGADVIVMGTHGRHGFSHLFIGSVAEHMVRHSPVPVWTVRPPEK